MNAISLNGAWTLTQSGEAEHLPATIPGCVHTDLLAAGELADPYWGDNEQRTLWVAERNWDYERRFSVPPEFLERERVLLRCEGLDTIASIYLNGTLAASTDNMFRTWEFDVKPLLVPGENSVRVHFASPMAYVRAKERERVLPAWGVGQHKLNGGGWIRKEPSNFGWDWGPMLATCGIWRDIELVGFDAARIEGMHVLEDHAQPGQVTLTVRIVLERTDAEPVKVECYVEHEGRAVAHTAAECPGDYLEARLVVENPHLWWPNGMGEQPLYEVRVEITSLNERRLDDISKRIGLRTLQLDRHPDQWGESFQFVANGVPFFAKGANWIPADQFATRVSYDDYKRLLTDAAAANMNMLRAWGGGIYEQDWFFDLCDELGLCVWQDFMFACATYPTFYEKWMANVKAEAEDNVRRLRHHACLALWCGNNELEQGLVGDKWNDHQMSWEDYSKLFDVLLSEVVGRLDPERDYWPSSPHTPCGDRRDFNNPNCGDAHLWSVWHGNQPFEWYRTCEHRFNSEFGFQSFPEPKTVLGYTGDEDRNITSYVMELHQRSGIGNTTIMTYMLDWFRLPTSFDDVLWLSQILQGMAIKYAVEHWRRAMPRGMGTLYWQINDCWPVASWSSIDYPGRWKTLHYMARKFYAPVLVSGLEDMQSGTVELHITSDMATEQAGEVVWLLTDVQGWPLARGTERAVAAPRADTLVTTLHLKPYLEAQGPRDLMLWLEFHVAGEIVSSNFVSFARPKHLELADPEIRAEVCGDAGAGCVVRLSAQKPALWVWLELEGYDARYSDNFFHLVPGRDVEVVVKPVCPLAAGEVLDCLRVRSLRDTYHSGIPPTGGCA